MRFDAHPVVRRRISLRGLGFATLAVVIIMGSAAAVIHLYVREKAVAKQEAELLRRRSFYEMIPGERLYVEVDDVWDRLIASLVVRNIAPKTDVQLRLEWLDKNYNRLAVSGWRRPISEKVVAIGADSMERYLHPDGPTLAGPRNMTIRVADFPPGTARLALTLVEPANLKTVFVRFYTRTPLQPGAQHMESALLEAREQRLEARTALPSTIAPQELIDRLTGWKWVTVAGSGSAKDVQLFRRDVQPGDMEAPAEGELTGPERVPGLRLGPSRPLAFAVDFPGEYELRVDTCGAGDVEIEKRVPGRLPESARVRLVAGKAVWRERLEPPMSLVVRKTSGPSTRFARSGSYGQAEVRMAYIPGDGTPELWMAPASGAAIAWLIGPLDQVALLRAAGAGFGLSGRLGSAPLEGPAGVTGSDILRFDWSPGAAAAGATVKLRVRGMARAGEIPPASVTVRYRIVGKGRLAIADERIEVPLTPADLERAPEGWCEKLEGLPPAPPGAKELPPEAPRDPWVITGAGQLFIEIPDEKCVMEIRTESPALVLPSHTLPQMRPVMQVPQETPDRTLCYIDPEPPDDTKVWHYLRPSNETDLRAAGAAIVLDLPDPQVKAPLRGATGADALWDREAAMPRRHAGSALALW
ncbi:MAG: hypothetical protein FD180_4673, partial [Planctomycetota bacterium]